MSARSGVFIKYVLEFAAKPAGGGLAGALAAVAGGAGASLKVSNDLLAGDVCVDADVSVVMSLGTSGATFKITLYDLPEKMAASLNGTPTQQQTVTISLGYFDTKVQLVLDGVYEKVESSATANQFVTTVTGREKALFACASTPNTASLQGKFSYASATEKVLSWVLANNNIPRDCVDGKPLVKGPLPDDPLNNPNFFGKGKFVLGALEKIASQAGSELLIVDKKVILGSPIVYGEVTPQPLDSGTNLAKFDKANIKIPGKDNSNPSQPATDKTIKGFKFVALGDPTMRPGQQIQVKNIAGYDTPAFSIRKVEHKFSATAGYTCEGIAAELAASGADAVQIDIALDRSAASAATDISDRIRSQAFDNPVIEIGSVKAAADVYRVNLNYGQDAQRSETQPSVNAAVKLQDDHVLQEQPIASPFAFRKCGLVTPVYPGMKAVVAHNRALSSDGIVTGYIWSKQPDYAPPENQAGDWWLCLPIDFDAAQPPGDSTKAVNDLTTNTGKRVLEVKGLKITIGASKLANIGKRPAEGADNEFLIEHASGTSVHIDANGALTIDASSASLTIKGDVVIEGSLEIK
jgi:hypothetical protein